MAIAKSLAIGFPAAIDTAVTAPAAGNPFTFSPDPAGGDFSAVFQAVGTVTTLSADLQVNLNGDGTTWSNIATAQLTNAAPAKTITNLVGGVVYRWNYTTASGTITVWGCRN